ncbi:MAG: hypothetical protein Fur002_23020 [Anaerolineales bacterium]
MSATFPALLFGLALSLLCGAVYHFFRNGGGWRLLADFLLSALGFAAGQALNAWRGWVFIRFGMLDIGFGVLGSFLLMALGEWLSRIDVGAGDESGL